MEVIEITPIGKTSKEDYVYDLETDDGTYLAGGHNGIIVKNTDSCYVMFDTYREDFETETDYMKHNFKLAEECAEEITKTFKNPIDLEFEKIMYPFFLFEKKRYAYQEWTQPEKPHAELEYKGIQIVRRDNCKYVKEVCSTLFGILMRERDEEKAVKYVQESIDKLLNNDVEIEKLVISKSLRGTYKVNGSQERWTNPNINMPHVKLAQKLLKTDPMNSPKPPDRVPYVFIENKNKRALQWEKVEHPDYLDVSKKRIDTLYYFEHQLKSPIDMIFNLLKYDPSQLYKNKVISKINKMNNQIDITNFFRRIPGESKKVVKKKPKINKPEKIKRVISETQSDIEELGDDNDD